MQPSLAGKLRSRHFVAAMLASALLVTACGGDDDASDAGGAASATSTPDGDDETTDETTDETKTSSSSPTTAIDPWRRTAVQVDFGDEETATVECPAGGEPYSVWGTETYTDDSSICTAAVHAGLITFDDGGDVEIRLTPGEESYDGTEENGVTTLDYGAWGGSFVFVD